MSDTYTISDNRAQTAIAMAKGEVWALKGWLKQRMYALRAEADKIEQLLEKASEQTDSWYEVICSERDAAARARWEAKKAQEAAQP